MKLLNLLLFLILTTSALWAETKQRDVFEFENVPQREIVKSLLEANNKKLKHFSGGYQELTFSFKGSPEEALQEFLQEYNLKTRAEGDQVDVAHCQPLPAIFQEALELSEEMELTSLDSRTGRELGSVKLSAIECRLASKAMKRSIDEGFMFARCFFPRHLLRIRHEGQDLSMLICFQCAYMRISPSESKDNRIFLGPDYGLTDILESHNIPVILGY